MVRTGVEEGKADSAHGDGHDQGYDAAGEDDSDDDGDGDLTSLDLRAADVWALGCVLWAMVSE
jgi:hypothetical protein